MKNFFSMRNFCIVICLIAMTFAQSEEKKDTINDGSLKDAAKIATDTCGKGNVSSVSVNSDGSSSFTCKDSCKLGDDD